MGEKIRKNPWDTAEQIEAKEKAQRELEERAERSRWMAERMTKPALRASELEYGGEQTEIDRGRYHRWLEENAPAAENMTSEQHDAVLKIDDGITFFNDQPLEKRQKFLETGDPDVFIDDSMEDNEKAGIRDYVGYLLSEKVFIEKTDGHDHKTGGWMIDPDFASEAVADAAVDTKISFPFHERFMQFDQGSRIDYLLEAAGDDVRLSNISLKEYSENPEAAMQKAKEEWYQSLSEEKRKELEEKYYADLKSAVDHWNDLSEDYRKAYLATGDIAALAGMPPDENFDAGSEKGQELTEMLSQLSDLGVITFGEGASKKISEDEGRSFRDEHIARGNDARKSEQAKEQERIDEIEKKIFQDDLKEARKRRESEIEKLENGPLNMSKAKAEAEVDGKIAEEVARTKKAIIGRLVREGKTPEEAEAEYEKRYEGFGTTDIERSVHDKRLREIAMDERRRKIDALREKRGRDFAEQQMAANGTAKEAIEKIQAQHPGLSLEEASRLAALTPEEVELQLRLMQMKSREEEGMTAETTFEGESGKARRLVLIDDENKKRYDFMSMEDLKKFAEDNGFDLESDSFRIAEVDLKDLEDKMSGLRGDEQLEATKGYLTEAGVIRRRKDESLEDFEARLNKAAEDYLARRTEQKREAISERVRREKSFREFVDASGKKVEELSDEELDELTERFYDSPEAAKAKLDEIKQRMASDKDFADFVRRNGLEPGLEGMSYRKLTEVVEKGFEDARDNRVKLAGMRDSLDELKQLVGVSFDIPEDLSGMSDDEVADKLNEVERMRDLRAKFVEMMASNEKFREFVKNTSDYAKYLDEEKQKTINGGLAEKILGEWNRTTGDIVMASVDYRESDVRAVDALTELMVQQYLNRGHFKSVRRLFEDSVRSRYHKKAEALFMSGGDAEGKFWEKFNGIDDFLEKHRQFYSKRESIMALTERPEGFELLGGEKGIVYRIRKEGDKLIPMQQKGDSYEDVSNPEAAQLVLDLYEIESEYLNGERGIADKERLKRRLEEYGAASSSEEKLGTRFSNFYDAIIDAGDKLDYVSGVELHERFCLSMAQFGRSPSRRAIFDRLKDNRIERLETSVGRFERTAETGLEQVKHPIGVVLENYQNAVSELEKNPRNHDARETMLKVMSFYWGYANKIGVIDFGENEADGRRQLQEIHDRGLRLLEDAYVVPSLPESAQNATRAQMKALNEAKILSDGAAFMEEAFESADELDFSIQVNDDRLDELTKGNGALLRDEIKKWNDASAGYRFKIIVGQEKMPGYVLSLVAAGLIRPTIAMEQIPTTRSEHPPRTDDEFEGVTGEDQITTLHFDDVDRMILIAGRDARDRGRSIGTEKEIKDAIERWNNASEIERNLFLSRGGNAKFDEEFLRAAEILFDAEFLNRTQGFGLASFDSERARARVASLSPEIRLELAQAAKRWVAFDSVTKDRCVRGTYDALTQGGNPRPALSDEAIDTYELLRKYDILPDPGSYRVNASFREEAERRRRARS